VSVVRTRQRRVVVVEDDPEERAGLAQLIRAMGYDVEAAATGEAALEWLAHRHADVVVSDLVLPGLDGLELLAQLKGAAQPPAVLMVTGHATVESAVEAMRRGAYDFVTKPLDPVRLEVLLDKAAAHGSLKQEVTLLRHRLRQKGSFGRILGEAKSMQEVYRWIELSATSMAPVLIHGESGTGKELVAYNIHERSERASQPLVAVNCAAIPETLIESELFGHERGAFTGATERRAGCFELADGGTLFLDEIAEMDPAVQAKLLRVLQEGTFRRVGGKSETKVSVRIIAATNRDPLDAVARGQLREDLYYRLNVFAIAVPPLRERGDDILRLAHAFVDEFNREDHRDIHGFDVEAERALLAYRWPGNVRQLRNVLQRAVATNQTGIIGPGDLSLGPGTPSGAGEPATRASDDDVPLLPLRELERRGIMRALRETNQNKPRAATLLGITVTALDIKLAQHALSPRSSSRLARVKP
jgi:DNA-binding NtrC family response regulator